MTIIFSKKIWNNFIMHISILLKYFKMMYNNDLCKVEVKVISRSNPKNSIKSSPFPCIFLFQIHNKVYIIIILYYIVPNNGSFICYSIILHSKPLKVVRLMSLKNVICFNDMSCRLGPSKNYKYTITKIYVTYTSDLEQQNIIWR